MRHTKSLQNRLHDPEGRQREGRQSVIILAAVVWYCRLLKVHLAGGELRLVVLLHGLIMAANDRD